MTYFYKQISTDLGKDFDVTCSCGTINGASECFLSPDNVITCAGCVEMDNRPVDGIARLTKPLSHGNLNTGMETD